MERMRIDLPTSGRPFRAEVSNLGDFKVCGLQLPEFPSWPCWLKNSGNCSLQVLQLPGLDTPDLGRVEKKSGTSVQNPLLNLPDFSVSLCSSLLLSLVTEVLSHLEGAVLMSAELVTPYSDMAATQSRVQ